MARNRRTRWSEIRIRWYTYFGQNYLSEIRIPPDPDFAPSCPSVSCHAFTDISLPSATIARQLRQRSSPGQGQSVKDRSSSLGRFPKLIMPGGAEYLNIDRSQRSGTPTRTPMPARYLSTKFQAHQSVPV